MIWSGKRLGGVCHHILVVRLTLLHIVMIRNLLHLLPPSLVYSHLGQC